MRRPVVVLGVFLLGTGVWFVRDWTPAAQGVYAYVAPGAHERIHADVAPGAHERIHVDVASAVQQDATGAGGTLDDMAGAASAFIATLDAVAREAALMPFDVEERFNWHYFPRERKGLALKQMSPVQRRAAHDLLRSSLSSAGYLKVGGIMFLEQVLHVLEGGNPGRDPEAYFFTVFGDPSSAAEPWGWRIEGHHLSLNYSSVAGEGVSVTPAFMGTNPATVPEGPAAGLRVLGLEEDLARELVRALDATQRTKAIIADEAPSDIITGTDRRARVDSAEGLPYAEMNNGQRELLLRLVAEFVDNLDAGLADEQMAKIQAAGFDNLRFAWAGGTAAGEGHYYRIQGPTVVFEYDNTQNDANHVHTVWRDLQNDFGEDLLRRHYEESSHHR